MKTKKALIISSIVGLFIFVNLTVALQFNPSVQKTGLISIFNSAFADDEGGGDPTVCLQTYVLEENKYFVRVKECWRDKPGPDVLEGYTGTCSAGGTGCNAAACGTQYTCYTVSL